MMIKRSPSVIFFTHAIFLLFSNVALEIIDTRDDIEIFQIVYSKLILTNSHVTFYINNFKFDYRLKNYK